MNFHRIKKLFQMVPHDLWEWNRNIVIILGLVISQTKDCLRIISMYLRIVPNIDLHLHIWKFINHLQNKVFHSFTSENNNNYNHSLYIRGDKI